MSALGQKGRVAIGTVPFPGWPGEGGCGMKVGEVLAVTKGKSSELWQKLYDPNKKILVEFPNSEVSLLCLNSSLF